MKKSLILILFLSVNNIFSATLSCQKKCLIPLNRCIAKHKCFSDKKNYLQCLKKNCYKEAVNVSRCKQKCPMTCEEKCKLPTKQCVIKNNCINKKNFKACMFNKCAKNIQIGKQCIAKCKK